MTKDKNFPPHMMVYVLNNRYNIEMTRVCFPYGVSTNVRHHGDSFPTVLLQMWLLYRSLLQSYSTLLW